MPTVAQLPSVTREPKPIGPPIGPPTGPPNAMPILTTRAAPVERATLPPTWTSSPPPTASPTPTLTPTVVGIPGDDGPTPHNTLSPAQLADTYWDGDGELSMWDLQFPDGTFGRFTIFPINFWVGTYGGITLSEAHEQAIQNALQEINQVVPIQRVDNRIFAHMTLWLMTDAEFDRNAPCSDVDLLIGCASPTYTSAGIMLVTIWLRVADQNFASTLLHELTHGLGIAVHSPHPEDIMYAYETGQPPHYTRRDLNTLRALYSAPPYDPRRQ